MNKQKGSQNPRREQFECLHRAFYRVVFILVIFATALLLSMPRSNCLVAFTPYLLFSGIAQLVKLLRLVATLVVLFLTQLWKSCTDSVGNCVSTFAGKCNCLLSVFVRAPKFGGYSCFLNIHENPPLSLINLCVVLASELQIQV